MLIHRRRFLVGLGSLLAAPAIVHAGNLMPISARNTIVKDIILEPGLETYIYELGKFDRVVFYGGINRKTSFRWVSPLDKTKIIRT